MRNDEIRAIQQLQNKTQKNRYTCNDLMQHVATFMQALHPHKIGHIQRNGKAYKNGQPV